jgi:uncharacterized protein YutD
MTELDKKIKDLKDFIKEKTDQGTANYLGKEIREICGMVETEQLNIHSVSKSFRDKEQFIELAKMIEIHIQKSVDYKASIGLGYFTERFNKVYKKYLESNVC